MKNFNRGILVLTGTLLFAPTFSDFSAFLAQAAPENSADLPLLRVETKNGLFPSVRTKNKMPALSVLIENPLTDDYSCQTATSLSARDNVTEINVKIRGNITRYYPKKGYQVDFVQGENLDEDRNVSLLEMSSSDKWPLIGPYYDRSLVRNSLAFDLARLMKYKENGRDEDIWYVPQYRFVEFMINCHYKGIYTLVERIERSKNRVNIDKFDWDNPEKSPFILKRDGKGFGISYSPGEFFTTQKGTKLTYVYPSDNKMKELRSSDPQKYEKVMNAMKSSVEQMEKILSSITKEDPKDEEWQKLIDVPSFAAFILMQEISKNIDGFRRSVFFYRDNEGKFHMGPVWDFDTAFGNLWFYGQNRPGGFQHGHRRYIDGNTNLFWFRQLLKSPRFASEVVKMYREMRSPGGALHDETIQEIFQSFDENLPQPAVKRNFKRWNVLGRPSLILPMVPPPYPKTHAGEVKKLRKWLDQRLKWLDRHIGSMEKNLTDDFFVMMDVQGD